MKLLTFIRQRSFARYIMVDVSEAARRLGWDVHWIDLEGRFHATCNESTDGKYQVVADMLLGIGRFNPDLVFSYGLEYLEPVFETYIDGFGTRFHEILRRPAVYYLCDFGYPFDGTSDQHVPAHYLAPLQSQHSLVLCWDRDATAALRRAGVTRAIYWPMAVNTHVFSPPPTDDERSPAIPVLFVGGPTRERVDTLGPIAGSGLTIHGYDPEGWRANSRLRFCYRGEVMEREHLRGLYRRARISINITRRHGASSLNMRVFEAMACGSLVLTDDRSDASALFADGKEIVVYRDAVDLAEKVTYFLANEGARRRIAGAGARKVHQTHTYSQRLRSIAPVVRQFYQEWRALRQADDFLAHDPAKAVRFACFLQAQDAVVHDVEHVRLLEGKARFACGDTRGATECVNEVLERNPRHLEADVLARHLLKAA